MAVLAADGARLGAHRHGLQPHAGEGLQVGHEHLVVGMLAGLAGQVEGIGVLHQELAAAHDAEARADLVAELPLDVIEIARHVLVGLNTLAEDVGDHLLIGGAEEHVAVMPVLDAQHLLAIGIVTAGLAPEVGGLDRGHQHLDGPCPVLFLAHDLLDLAQHAVAHGEPGIAARRLLPNHAAAQHELVGDDFRFLGIVAQNGHEILGKAHEGPASGARAALLRETPRNSRQGAAGFGGTPLHIRDCRQPAMLHAGGVMNCGVHATFLTRQANRLW